MQFKQKAIFLDRDGVIISERGDYTWLLEDLKVNDGVIEALKLFSSAGFILIVISNQSGISKKIYSKADADYLHLHLERFFLNHGIKFHEFYYCPHHPDFSKCICRKPDSLLLEKALWRFEIDAANSWFIGDAERDIVAGKKAGVRVIKIEPNDSLMNVVDLILT